MGIDPATLGEPTSKKNKFNAKRTTRPGRAGRSFASGLEALVFDHFYKLKLLGEVEEIVQQPRVFLTRAEISYHPDLAIKPKGGALFWVEAKGVEGERWRIVRKLWTVYGPGKLEVWKAGKRGPVLYQSIIP